MRRVLSVQAWRALFSTVPRVLTVVVIVAVLWGLSSLTQQFVPWWVWTIVGLLMIAFFAYLGSVWLERDIVRNAERDSREK